ncbi:hypothetical protein [Agrococcus jejuensis]|uniref:DUF308 domain-containing protein n=1 Tax=Agrococcus jejuensis TaxID=399736 RepID=A0A1G8D885_9MICO|nr:hypothetical protein [Agrococcus jejuensis]SDH53714.1 hypothetical protein SAMN04489720_1546 [Agrococcus jejuensis]
MSTIEQQGDHTSPTPSERPVWQLPAARAVPAVAVGVAVTFLQSHDALVGLVAFAVVALGTGAALLALRGAVYAEVARFPRVAGIAGLVAGVVAIALAIAAPSGLALKVVVAAWAIVAAAVEGWAWFRLRATTDPKARRIAADWRFVAAFTLVAAIVFACMPSHDVVLVGLVGAYAVIVGVFHGIAAYSARAAAKDAREATA